MHICYIDESGTQELTGGTSHFVLLGLSIPDTRWRTADIQIKGIKKQYALEQIEVHTGWMTRRFLEQDHIPEFDKLSYSERRTHVEKEREKSLIKASLHKNKKAIKEKIKNYKKTAPYIHLTYEQRIDCLRKLCDLVGMWDHCTIFGEAIDKTSFNGIPPKYPPYEEAFGNLVTRFQGYLAINSSEDRIGLLVQDNNESMAKRLTTLMHRYHFSGTMWCDIPNIIETPLFVDSSLTSMIQIADLCAYALRRYFEKNETDLFNRIKVKIDRSETKVIGFRHYVGDQKCSCYVCKSYFNKYPPHKR